MNCFDRTELHWGSTGEYPSNNYEIASLISGSGNNFLLTFNLKTHAALSYTNLQILLSVFEAMQWIPSYKP